MIREANKEQRASNHSLNAPKNVALMFRIVNNSDANFFISRPLRKRNPMKSKACGCKDFFPSENAMRNVNRAVDFRAALRLEISLTADRATLISQETSDDIATRETVA